MLVVPRTKSEPTGRGIPLRVRRPSLPPLGHDGERNWREFLDVHYRMVHLGDAQKHH